MRKIITMLFIGLITVGLSGCSSKKDSLIADDEYSQVMEIFEKLIEKNEIIGIGVAPPNRGDDVSFQESEAMAVARTRISKLIETKVGASLKKFVQTTGIEDKESFVRDVREPIVSRTKNTIRGAKVKKRVRGKSGKIYILMTLKTKEVLDALKQSVSNLNDKDIQFQRFLSEKNQKELEKELENYEK